MLAMNPDRNQLQHTYVRHSFDGGTSCRVGKIMGSFLNQPAFLLTVILISGFNI